MAETYFGVDWGAKNPEVVALHRMALERLRMKATVPVTLDVMDQLQGGLDVLSDLVAEELLFMLTTELAANNHWTDRQLYKFPASWWDHWKQDAAPSWLRRFLKPVRTEAIYEELRAYRVCPHVDIPRNSRECFRWLADG